jgi:hypothetical protein
VLHEPRPEQLFGHSRRTVLHSGAPVQPELHTHVFAAVSQCARGPHPFGQGRTGVGVGVEGTTTGHTGAVGMRFSRIAAAQGLIRRVRIHLCWNTTSSSRAHTRPVREYPVPESRTRQSSVHSSGQETSAMRSRSDAVSFAISYPSGIRDSWFDEQSRNATLDDKGENMGEVDKAADVDAEAAVDEDGPEEGGEDCNVAAEAVRERTVRAPPPPVPVPVPASCSAAMMNSGSKSRRRTNSFTS